MRSVLMTLGAFAVLGCASAGIPALGDPDEAIRIAEQQIEQASQAGADSLASLQIGDARRALAEAQQQRRENREWSALRAREAAASAAYARAIAGKTRADRAKNDANTALQQVPPGGAR